MPSHQAASWACLVARVRCPRPHAESSYILQNSNTPLSPPPRPAPADSDGDDGAADADEGDAPDDSVHSFDAHGGAFVFL